MTLPLALIVDDEPDIRELLEITLERMNIRTRGAANLTQAYQALSKEAFDLCLADMRLPDGDGIELVKYIAQHFPQTPVAMITAHGNVETAVDALKSGAFDFVSKPVDLGVLRKLVDTALKLSTINHQAPEPETNEEELCPLQGRSQPMQAIRAMINKLGRSQAPVYISGESGTGKELAARLIHQRSPRSALPFVAVNCGAIPHELMESELFGHKKGSFTGAIADKEGLFQAAQGGTLFLDEVADLPLSLQVKLLRVIQEKTVRPVGSAKEQTVDVRLISATHQNLAEAVQEGRFRKDLFYRLNVIELTMPPLRERTGDIELLIRYLSQRIANDYGVQPPEFSPEAMDALLSYPYPGNVRELENVLERAFALREGDRIVLDDLGLPCEQSVMGGDAPMKPGEGLEAYLDRVERGILRQALEETKGNKTAAARKLSLSFRAFRYRLGKLGLDDGVPEE